MLGVIVNAAAITAGGLLGKLAGNLIPEKYSSVTMTGIGLCVVYIGLEGAVSNSGATLVVILSMILGGILGEALDLDGAVERLGNFAERHLTKGGETGRISRGFVSASLLFCIGAMAIMGPITAGISGDNTMLFTKSMLDGISSVALGSTLGIGVCLSAVPLLLYQGAFCLLASTLSPFLTAHPMSQLALLCTGNLMILAIGLNLLGITKIKVANFLPAVFFAPLLALLPFLIV